MEHYIEHSLPASWSDVNKGPWSFGDGGLRLSDMMEYASVSDDAPVNKRLLRPVEETLDTSSLPPPQCLPQANYGANPPQTWCQSYINGPRSRPTHAGSSVEAAQDETHGRNGSAHILPFSGSTGDPAAHFGPSQLNIHADRQQMQGHQAFAPPFGTDAGIVPAQGASGTARPRVRARRGQATDPHSIAERLRRERIAERMKALQELVPNANKTDKASMLDEIIDYVKFLQLQVKVLSMSRLGGAGAVAPFIADFPDENQGNLAFNDGMVVAERQVARLMEEDMGSAMQFLQGKGLCLMPVSLATVISSSSNSRMTVGGVGGQQGFSAVDHSRIHPASSTSSTLASVASSGCIGGGEGESKSKSSRHHQLQPEHLPCP